MKKIEYREQALKILPWVCASCGRDFSGKKLRELTVHHKDHNFKNNPPDGSNWEMLCLYCHDNEHSRDLDAEWLATEDPDRKKVPITTHNPFAKLANLLRTPDTPEGKDESE
jgi:5-methylcytosine-specific restriction endonuclease McrA